MRCEHSMYIRASHGLAGSSSRQPRPLIGTYVCNAFAEISVCFHTLRLYFKQTLKQVVGIHLNVHKDLF